jgi:hypothetical protein
MIRQLRPKLILTRYPDLVFWVCFSALNLLLFLPWYLFNQKITTLWPLSASLDSAPLDVIKELALRRENLDPFRLNLEITLLVALWVMVGWLRLPCWRRIYPWFFLAIYLGTLGYYTTEHLSDIRRVLWKRALQTHRLSPSLHVVAEPVGAPT